MTSCWFSIGIFLFLQKGCGGKGFCPKQMQGLPFWLALLIEHWCKTTARNSTSDNFFLSCFFSVFSQTEKPFTDSGVHFWTMIAWALTVFQDFPFWYCISRVYTFEFMMIKLKPSKLDEPFTIFSGEVIEQWDNFFASRSAKPRGSKTIKNHQVFSSAAISWSDIFPTKKCVKEWLMNLTQCLKINSPVPNVLVDLWEKMPPVFLADAEN